MVTTFCSGSTRRTAAVRDGSSGRVAGVGGGCLCKCVCERGWMWMCACVSVL